MLVLLALAVKYWWCIVGAVAVVAVVGQLSSRRRNRRVDAERRRAATKQPPRGGFRVPYRFPNPEERRRERVATDWAPPGAFTLKYRLPTPEERRRAEAERARLAAEFAVAAAERQRLRDLEYAKSPLAEIDLMSGIEFEKYIAARMRLAGYDVELTSATGDYGVDLIATKGDHRLAVQCKRHGKPVGVAAIQAVFSGAKHHGCAASMVVSNQQFTPEREVDGQETRFVYWSVGRRYSGGSGEPRHASADTTVGLRWGHSDMTADVFKSSQPSGGLPHW
jgi:hypothetical protein